jgi:hypothetical protein
MGLGTLDDGIQLLDVYQTSNWKKYKEFQCPSNPQNRGGSGAFSYGYNLNLVVNGVGRNYNTLRSDMIVVHCANHYAPADPVSGGVSGNACNPGIHGDGFDNYLFTDGHIEKSDSFKKKASGSPPWLSLY